MNRAVTIAQLEKLRAALVAFPATPPENVHPVLHEASRDAIVSQIADLELELAFNAQFAARIEASEGLRWQMGAADRAEVLRENGSFSR